MKIHVVFCVAFLVGATLAPKAHATLTHVVLFDGEIDQDRMYSYRGANPEIDLDFYNAEIFSGYIRADFSNYEGSSNFRPVDGSIKIDISEESRNFSLSNSGLEAFVQKNRNPVYEQVGTFDYNSDGSSDLIRFLAQNLDERDVDIDEPYALFDRDEDDVLFNVGRRLSDGGIIDTYANPGNLFIYDVDNVDQAIFINWEESPVTYENQCNIFGRDCETAVVWNQTTTNTLGANLSEYDKTQLISGMRDIFAESGLNNIPIFDDPELVNVFDSVSTLSFHDRLSFNTTLSGIAYNGVDHLNQTSQNEDATVFWYANETFRDIDEVQRDTLYQLLSNTMAHEAGHMFGARHVHNTDCMHNVMFWNNSNFSFNDTEKFVNEIVPIGRPGFKRETNEGELHNPRYHVGISANGDSSRDLSRKRIDPGAYDVNSQSQVQLNFAELSSVLDLASFDIGYLDSSASLGGVDVFRSLFKGGPVVDTISINAMLDTPLVVRGKSTQGISGYDVVAEDVSIQALIDIQSLELFQLTSVDERRSLGRAPISAKLVETPEPSTLSLLMLFGLLGWFKRNR